MSPKFFSSTIKFESLGSNLLFDISLYRWTSCMSTSTFVSSNSSVCRLQSEFLSYCCETSCPYPPKLKGGDIRTAWCDIFFLFLSNLLFEVAARTYILLPRLYFWRYDSNSCVDRGNRSMNLEPSPKTDSTSISPPSARAMFLLITRPSPTPSLLSYR
jgi:hypothetical protein